MSTLLAATHLHGPHIDWAGLSPLVALLGGATIETAIACPAPDV